MSTPGSVRSGEAAAQYTPAAAGRRGSPAELGRAGDQLDAKCKRTRIFRWEGIIPIAIAFALVFAGWIVFGDRVVRNTMTEAGSKALGTQLDIADLRIRSLEPGVEMRGIAIADPFDRNKNLVEVGLVRVELEAEPLLEKKIVIKRLSIADVRTDTRRSTPARAVTGGGFAPRALAEVQHFAQQFKVPLLSLVPIDTLKSIILDPSKLRAVQAALALDRNADSAKQALEGAFAQLRLQETLDSSRALVTRLQGTNVRALGVDGARKAIADVRRASSDIDAAKRRVDALVANVRHSSDSLQSQLRAIDAARREDYDFARGLLQLPSFDAPDIGAALFGKVSIDKFQQAMYWATLARSYAPPGLLPKESPGPKRVRRAGSTVHFVAPRSYPRFWLRRADISVTSSAGFGGGRYSFAASDVTTDPAIVGRPTLFAVRRSARGGDVDSVRVTGMLDHLGARAREVANVQAAGVKLPVMSIPSLPFAMDPGRGASEMRFALDGDQLSGRWVLHSTNISWKPDSARSRKLNTMETLIARVLTGVKQLDMTADIGGTIKAPRLAVKSNLDHQIADRLRAVAGEEIASAQTKVRAHVDKLVNEKTAPVKQKIETLRADGERRVAEARTKLDEEKRRLDERLKALSGGALGLPRLPGG